MSWDLRSGDFKCYQFTFKRAGIAHTLCYLHDSDWNPVLVSVMEESTDIKDLRKLSDSLHFVSKLVPKLTLIINQIALPGANETTVDSFSRDSKIHFQNTVHVSFGHGGVAAAHRCYVRNILKIINIIYYF